MPASPPVSRLRPAEPGAGLVEEHTVLGPGSLRNRISITLDDGRRIRLSGPVVLGRDPVRPSTHTNATPVAVADPDRSVSKTHLLIGPASAGAWLIDLHSTNGVTVLDEVGEELDPAAPGQLVLVRPGSTVRYGRRVLEVHA